MEIYLTPTGLFMEAKHNALSLDLTAPRSPQTRLQSRSEFRRTEYKARARCRVSYADWRGWKERLPNFCVPMRVFWHYFQVLRLTPAPGCYKMFPFVIRGTGVITSIPN